MSQQVSKKIDQFPVRFAYGAHLIADKDTIYKNKFGIRDEKINKKVAELQELLEDDLVLNVLRLSDIKKHFQRGISMSEGLNKTVSQVKEFHSAFGHPVSNHVQPLKLERGTARAVWTGEEALVEFLHQSSDNEEEFLSAYDKMIAGLEKAKQKSLAEEYPKTELDKVVGQADALTDAFYFLAGSFVEMGVMPQPLFDIVQAANMAKLGPDGKPIIRESDNKIMKPEGWKENHAPEPKLRAEIEGQTNEA